MSDIAKQAEELGLAEILYGRRRFDEVRLDLYRKAQNVSWLATHPGLPPGSSMEEEIGKCLENGTNFRIMGWAGDSPSEDVKGLPERVRRFGGRKGRIEVRYYKEEPKWYIQMIDDVIYAQPYLHGASMFKLPVFVVKKVPEWYGLYNRFEAHFTELWNTGVPIESFTGGSDEGKSL